MHTNGIHLNGSGSRPNFVTTVERPEPQNIDAERALLGAVLYDNRCFAEVCEVIDSADLLVPDHVVIWSAIVARLEAGEKADPITLRGALGDDLARVAGSLVAQATTTQNAPGYAAVVKEAAVRRRLVAFAHDAIEDAHNGALPLPDLLQATAADLAMIRGTLNEQGAPPVISRCVADIDPEPIRWLWTGRFALGKLSIIAGEPGVGKSQLTCAFAATVTTAGAWPDGSRAPLGSAVFISCEDDAADTIRPRLEAAGADLRRVRLLDWVIDAGSRRHFDIGAHVANLAGLVREVGDVRLIVIDPISAYMGRADSHVVAEVRQALAPLQAMAGEMGPAIVLISHLNKGSSANGAMARVAGSGAFVAATRAAFMVGKDPNDQTKRRRVLLPLKTNVGEDDTTGFAYRVESWRRGEIATSCIAWEPGTVTMSAEDLLKPAAPADDAGGALADAEAFLRTELADGPKPSAWIRKAARDAGISARTLDRARDSLGIKPKKLGAGGWVMALPAGQPGNVE